MSNGQTVCKLFMCEFAIGLVRTLTYLKPCFPFSCTVGSRSWDWPAVRSPGSPAMARRGPRRNGRRRIWWPRGASQKEPRKVRSRRNNCTGRRSLGTKGRMTGPGLPRRRSTSPEHATAARRRTTRRGSTVLIVGISGIPTVTNPRLSCLWPKARSSGATTARASQSALRVDFASLAIGLRTVVAAPIVW